MHSFLFKWDLLHFWFVSRVVFFTFIHVDFFIILTYFSISLIIFIIFNFNFDFYYWFVSLKTESCLNQFY